MTAGVTWEAEPCQGSLQVCSTRPPSLPPATLSLRSAGLEGPQPMHTQPGEEPTFP